MEKNEILIFSLLIILTAFLNFSPHLTYKYPFHVDEWIHYQFAAHLSKNSPKYFETNNQSLEHGFHILLAVLNLMGVPYSIIFLLFPAAISAFIATNLYIVSRKISGKKAAIFAIVFFAMMKSSISNLGTAFLVPLSLGLLFLTTGIFLLEIKSKSFFIILAALLIIHPPSALAYLLIINSNLLIYRKNFFEKIILQMAAFAIASPLYLETFLTKGISAINYLSYETMTSPVDITSFFGHSTIILAGFGIYSTMTKKRYDLITYTLIFTTFIALFYYAKTEIFLPYARTLIYLFIILSILSGIGCSHIIDYFKNEKIKVFIAAILLIVIISTLLPSKIESENQFYKIIDEKDEASFYFIRDNTPKESVVLSDPWIANALTPLAERKVYSRIVQRHSKDHEEKNEKIRKFFYENCTDTKFLIEKNISIIYNREKCNNSNLEEVYNGVYILKKNNQTHNKNSTTF